MVLELIAGIGALTLTGTLIIGSALLASRRDMWSTRDPVWIDPDQERARNIFTPSTPVGRESEDATSLAGKPVSSQ